MKPQPSYKTAEELKITPEEHLALSDVVTDLLALGPFQDESNFTMRGWGRCIYGKLRINSICYNATLERFSLQYSPPLAPLFVPTAPFSACWSHCEYPWDATPTQAAQAVVHFLTHGE